MPDRVEIGRKAPCPRLLELAEWPLLLAMLQSLSLELLDTL
jgi:hypothetical protein